MVESIVRFAHALDLDVTAEGIDTQADLSLVSSLHCAFLQGDLFSGLMSAQDVELAFVKKPLLVDAPSADSPTGLH